MTVIVLPGGACPDGLMLVTFCPKPNCCWPFTWNPSDSRVCCTWEKRIPIRLPGIATSGGPWETETATVEPGGTGVPAGVPWATMMPCGLLLFTVVGCRRMLFWLAHC